MARTPRTPRTRKAPTDAFAAEPHEEVASDEDGDFEDAGFSSPNKASTSALEEGGPAIIAKTAFDAYFLHAAKATKTSSNVFSNLVQPLSPEEYAQAINSIKPRPRLAGKLGRLTASHSSYFSQYLTELEQGFNLFFYGFGSKRAVLNQFASETCSRRGHVVIVNAFLPTFTLKDMLNSIEKIPGITDLPISSTTNDGQTRRICDFFSQPAPPNRRRRRTLYLIIHNIDSPGFRSSKAKSCLSLLSAIPNIRIVASIDHISTPLLFSSSELSSHNPTSSPFANSDPSRTNSPLDCGHAWLWHDLTTLANYDFELSFADRASIAGASSMYSSSSRAQLEAATATAAGALMTETAAQHILASVTQKAKKLFVLMAETQLASIEEHAAAADANTNPGPVLNPNDIQRYAIGYETLFNNARDNFIATNDTAFKALLGEFRDHGLVLSGDNSAAGGGEVLWIPMRKERLAKILDELRTET